MDRTEKSLPFTVKEFLEYFNSLNKDNFDPSDFRKYWPAIRQFNLTAIDLAKILNKTASQFCDYRFPPSHRVSDILADRGMIYTWLAKMAPKITELDARGLSDTLTSFAKLKIIPPRNFLESLQKEIITKIDTFNSRDVTNTLWSFATLGLQPGNSFIDLCYSQLLTCRNVSARDISDFIWSVSVLSSFENDHDTYRDKIEGLLYYVEKQNPNLKDRREIDAAALWFNLPRHRQFYSPETYLHEIQKAYKTQSIWAETVEAKFSDPDFIHDIAADKHLPELQRDPDIRLTYKNRDIIMDVDGRSHFVYDAEDNNIYFNGATRFQNALLEWIYSDSIAIRIRSTDDRELGPSKIVSFLKSQFNTIAPGVYVTGVEKNEPVLTRASEQVPVNKIIDFHSPNP